MKKIFLIPALLMICAFANAQCPATVTITGTYATAYTGSNSWIATSGTTTIPSGADVTLDANPVHNGYVLMDAGFETQPNTTFLAVVVTDCFPLHINDEFLANEVSVYPNPIHDVVNVKANSKIIESSILDIHGKTLINNKPNSVHTLFDISNYSTGIYLLKITTSEGTKTIKVTKE
jgi:hypothetical protein